MQHAHARTQTQTQTGSFNAVPVGWKLIFWMVCDILIVLWPWEVVGLIMDEPTKPMFTLIFIYLHMWEHLNKITKKFGNSNL